MAKRIRWSELALIDLEKILKYLLVRNASPNDSKKLNTQLENAIQFIAQWPAAGRLTTVEGIRLRLVKDYWIIYEEEKEDSVVHRIFDTRRAPEELDLIFRMYDAKNPDDENT